MSPLKLYHYSLSPPSQLALMTIRHLKLEVEIITVDLLKQDQLSPEFIKVNPQHTVPTIDDNGFILWESRAIATYLVSSKAPGSSLYPTDVKKRAVVDARLHLDHELYIALREVVFPIYALGSTEIPQDKKDKVYKILGNLNTFLEGQKYAAGSELTIADLALLATITSLQEIGANICKFSNVSAWLKSLDSIPGAQENLEGAQLFGNFIKSKINQTDTWESSHYCCAVQSVKMATLKYYYYPEGAPNRAALLTIRNLNLDAEVIFVDLRKKEHLTEKFVKMNPQRCMPLLDDNGFLLCESRAISQYLVTTRAPGSSLYPTDPKKRALVDARLYLDTTLHAVSRSFFFPIHSMGETKIPELPKQRLYQLLGYLNDMMEDKLFVAGDELTIADFSILASFSTYYHCGANVKNLKNLIAWYKRCESLPGFQENEDAAKDFGDMFKSKLNIKESWEELEK
ncbi:uncharacterized protein LOC132261706 [Phlebotomus argentipes]|uniref:uncharacterized protein LOC132261706 n=1 Tax=Phlebotomus argentipes TaxID=94469 RepID=UPI002892F4D4|nr:uncharacterized protein LOC132261706 [Phlebotomus argentipes]